MWLLACESEPEPAAEAWSLGETVQVVPADGLPAEVEVQDSANNLDVVQHDGRVYLAFRTAPSHFASTETVMWVVSSGDELTWELETSFAMQTDLREPRLLSWNGRLWLYFAVLGDDPNEFEPQGAMVSERVDGSWTTPAALADPGFIPWRTKVVAGVPYMTGYTGGENIYDADGEPLEVYWLTTSDGETWTGVDPASPVVATGGGSETDFALLDDGSVVAVTRNEAGDETGWGSKICTAPAGELAAWDCVGDPRKYDSPLVFEHAGRVWLLGRRNVTESGNYDLERRDLTAEQQTLYYEADYWIHPKRCSLWEVDPQARAVHFVLDLPSRGDTCFPGILEGAGSFAVYNYSSPIDGDDVSWVEGQNGETRIYRTELTWE